MIGSTQEDSQTMSLYHDAVRHQRITYPIGSHSWLLEDVHYQAVPWALILYCAEERMKVSLGLHIRELMTHLSTSLHVTSPRKVCLSDKSTFSGTVKTNSIQVVNLMWLWRNSAGMNFIILSFCFSSGLTCRTLCSFPYMKKIADSSKSSRPKCRRRRNLVPVIACSGLAHIFFHRFVLSFWITSYIRQYAHSITISSCFLPD